MENFEINSCRKEIKICNLSLVLPTRLEDLYLYDLLVSCNFHLSIKQLQKYSKALKNGIDAPKRLNLYDDDLHQTSWVVFTFP